MPEFLIYVPDVSKYATFFMSSKTMRRVAADLKTLMGSAATIRSQLISNKRYKWHGPVISNCSLPLAIPPKEEMVEIINAFNNPPKLEEVEEAPEDDRPR